MINRILSTVFSLAALTASPAAHAQDVAVAQMPGIKNVTKVTTGNNVRPNLYYTQLQITTSQFDVPSDTNSRKRLGKALLETLGLRKETRSIIVSVAVSTNLATYPEYPVLVYKFDGKSQLLQIDRIGSVTLPLQRLDPAEPLRVKFTYRNSKDIAVDMRGAADAIAAMVPGNTLVSFVTQPFVGKVTDVAGAVFGLASSGTVASSLAEEMSPYGSSFAKKMTVELDKPGGGAFGTLVLDILATPTLQRASTLASTTTATGDFKLQDGEGATTLVINVGGVERNLVTEIKGLDTFVRLSKERTPQAAKAFCDASRSLLATQFKLTLMDRALVMHQAMFDADPTATRGAWYEACFDAQEVVALTHASEALAKPAVATRVEPAGPIPVYLKDAIGCLMTGKKGEYCTSRAPNARQILLDAMADQVRVGQMDYAGIIDINSLDPATRLVGKTALADALTSKAHSFSCYGRGLYLGVDSDTKAYSFEASLVDGKVSAIQLIAIPVHALQCI